MDVMAVSPYRPGQAPVPGVTDGLLFLPQEQSEGEMLQDRKIITTTEKCMGRDGMGWDGMGWDGMGWDGMGWDGLHQAEFCVGLCKRWEVWDPWWLQEHNGGNRTEPLEFDQMDQRSQISVPGPLTAFPELEPELIICSLMKRHQGCRTNSTPYWGILWLFACFSAWFGWDPVWKRSPPFWEHVGKINTRKSPFPTLAPWAAPVCPARWAGFAQGAKGIRAPRCPALPAPTAHPSAHSPSLPGSMWLPACSAALYPHPPICRHFVGHFAPQSP